MANLLSENSKICSDQPVCINTVLGLVFRYFKSNFRENSTVVFGNSVEFLGQVCEKSQR